MATNLHTNTHQQPAIVQIALGTGGQTLHTGMWMLRKPTAAERGEAAFDHSEQLLIDQAGIAAFEQLEPDFDSRPVEVAYRADFETEEAAVAFVNWAERFDEHAVWCERDGCGILMGFDAPLHEEMLLKASALVHYSVRAFGGVFTGWGMKEDGKSWMTVVRAELEVPSTLH